MTSRIPAFYALSVAQRRERVAATCKLDPKALAALDDGGLTVEACEQMVENVIGRYALPYAIATNFVINDVERLIPMVVEEPSVVAAASNAARIIRQGTGFQVEVSEPIMLGQVWLLDVPDFDAATRAVKEKETELLRQIGELVPSLVRRGGGATKIEVRELSKEGVLGASGAPRNPSLVVHFHLHTCDAMGANLVNTVAEGIAPTLARLTGGRVGMRILSNLATERTASVKVRFPVAALNAEKGLEIAKGIEDASYFAEADVYRAATHNKGIMNGVDSVIMAFANDWRSVEAGAHAFAAREGRYAPLATWHVEGDDLVGQMQIPMAVGTVGGSLQMHELAQLSLQILNTSEAKDLAAASAAAGLACNLAALKALATEGIQRGHMALHKRIVERARSHPPHFADTKENAS